MKKIGMVATFAVASALSLEVRAQDCATDADCDEGYICEVSQVTLECEADPDGGCAEEPAMVEYGECVPEPLVCESDADCPSGLTCLEQDAPNCVPVSGAPGGSPGEADCGEAPDEKLCTLVLVECTDDSDCPAREECIPSGLEECSSPPPCVSGECSDELICEPVDSPSVCFAEQVACSNDADCGQGQVCYELGELADDLPPTWEPGQGSKFCFSEGFALALEGKVPVAGTLDANSSSESSRDSVSGSASDDEQSDPTAESSSPSGNNDGGCTLTSSAPSGATGTLALVLLGLVARARRFSSS